LWWWHAGRYTTLRLKGRALAAWAAGFAVVVAALPWIESALLFTDGSRRQLLGSSGRGVMWAQIADGALQSPWLGYGWNSTAAAQIAGSTRHPGNLSTSYAHNIVLDAIAWFGIPFGLLIVGVFAVWWLRRARAARGHVAVLTVALALPVLSHSLFEFP